MKSFFTRLLRQRFVIILILVSMLVGGSTYMLLEAWEAHLTHAIESPLHQQLTDIEQRLKDLERKVNGGN